jgi:hypothetical protein
MQVRVVGPNLLRQAANLSLGAEIRYHEVDLLIPAGRRDFDTGLFAAVPISCHHHDGGAHARQSDGRRLANARASTGDQADFVLHRVHLSNPGDVNTPVGLK